MDHGTLILEKMVQTILQEHVRNRTAEQTMDILMPPLIGINSSDKSHSDTSGDETNDANVESYRVMKAVMPVT